MKDNKDQVYVRFDKQNGKVIEAFGNEVEEPFITVPSSVWMQWSVYGLNNMIVKDGELILDQTVVDKVQLEKKIREANVYLASTDWVEPHIIRHQLSINVLPEDSNKLAIHLKREETRAFLRASQ